MEKICPAPHITASRWAALRSRIWRGAGSARTTAAGSSAGGSTPSGDVTSLAQHVTSGEFGNGKERKRQLGSNYAVVQHQINKMLS